MARALSSSDLARLEQATRTLLSPLAVPDEVAWREEVVRTLSVVLGGQGSTFMIEDTAEVA